jgi:hypothetical protein
MLSLVKRSDRLFNHGLLYELIGFLQSQRDGAGGFKLGQNGLDDLGNPEKEVADLYILASLINHLGPDSGHFTAEIYKFNSKFDQFRSSKGSNDPYEMALACFIQLKLNQTKGLSEVFDKILAKQNPSTGKIEGAKTSITRSSGESLDVETSALALIVLVNYLPANYSKQIALLIKYLTAQMSSTFYLSTQGTILTLIGFYDFFNKMGQKSKSNVVFEVSVNGKSAGEIKISSQATFANSTCVDITKALGEEGVADGPVTVEVAAPSKEVASNDDSQYLFQVNLEYSAEKPTSHPKSPLRVKMDAASAGKTRTYQISIHNSLSTHSGMVVYEFAKPSCLSYDLKSLDDLRLSQAVDYYEIRESGRNLVFYFRGIAATGSRSFTISLTAGNLHNQHCKERTHTVYQYYDKSGSVVYVLPETGANGSNTAGFEAPKQRDPNTESERTDKEAILETKGPIHTPKVQTEDSV